MSTRKHVEDVAARSREVPGSAILALRSNNRMLCKYPGGNKLRHLQNVFQNMEAHTMASSKMLFVQYCSQESSSVAQYTNKRQRIVCPISKHSHYVGHPQALASLQPLAKLVHVRGIQLRENRLHSRFE